MLLMRVRLSLDGDVEVHARLANSADDDIVAIWPLAFKLLLLVVLCEGVLGDFVIEENGVGGGESFLAGWVCAFDFGVLQAADAVGVVVDGCLKNCSFPQLHPLNFSHLKGWIGLKEGEDDVP